ncbi:MAG: hypothetical protein J2P41_08800, partial [Blastocatellia bacterium]|nr:hypothetical protein [Blastocatellia bacterium]
LIPTVYKLDPNLKASYTINYNLSVEQQLPRGLIATLSFIHVDGVHLLRLRDINAPFPGTEQRPNPAEGSIYDYESTGRSTFDGFFFGFNRRISQRLTFFANYGLSWAHSDTGGLPANNYDLHSEWGRSSSDRRHNFSTIVNLNLPHGFRLNPVVNAFSGAPFNITTGVDENGDFQLTDRPAGINRNADLPASLYSLIPDRLICQPGTTPFRSAGGTACNTSGNPQMPILIPQMQLRDFLAQYYPNGVKAEGPGNFNVNMYLSKTIGFGKRNSGGQLGQGGGGRGGRGGFGGGGGGRGGLGGGPGGGGPFGGGGENARVNVTFTLGVTNLFNHLNYGQDGGTLGAAFFGIPSSANPPRQFDFMVRFGF